MTNTGCKSEDDPPVQNGMAGTSGGMNAAAGQSGGGAGGAGGAGGEAGTNPAGGAGGSVTGGAGGANPAGGAGGTGTGGGGGDSGTGGTPGDGTSWTHVGYDQTNTYFNPHETKISVESAPTLVEKWSFPTAGIPHGGVSIAEGKVFATTQMGTYGINLADGTEAWYNQDAASEGTAAYDNGAVYVHTVGALILKLDAATGDEIWRSEKTYNLAGADGTSSAVVGGGKVIVGHSCGANEVGAAAATSFGGVEAFDTETGERAWTYMTGDGTSEDGAMVWSTVSIDVEGGVVYAATGNNYTVGGGASDAIHAIDLETGDRVWMHQVRAGDTWSLFGGGSQDTDFGANPILATIDGQKVVAAGDKGSSFWVLDRMTGDEIWHLDNLSSSHTPANGGVLNNGAFDGKNFYVSSNQPPSATTVHALTANADGAAAWPKKDFPVIIWGMSSVANGVLVVPVNTELMLFNAETGDMLKMFDTGGTIAAGAPAIADGMIVVKSGMTYAFAGLDAVAGQKIYAYGLP